MKYSIRLIALIIPTLLLITGCRSTLVGTWDSVKITHLQEVKPPTAKSIRMVMTPENDSFLILKNDDGSHDTWHSRYRTDGDRLFVQYLMDPEVFRFKFTDGNLTVENEEIKVVFQRVR